MYQINYFVKKIVSLQNKYYKMEKNKAIEVLLQVAQLAQSKGILSLKDAVIVAQAVEVLTPKEE